MIKPGDTEWEKLKTKKRIEYKYAKPYLDWTTIDNEGALRDEVRHVITTYLSEKEKAAMREEKRAAFQEIETNE